MWIVENTVNANEGLSQGIFMWVEKYVHVFRPRVGD